MGVLEGEKQEKSVRKNSESNNGWHLSKFSENNKDLKQVQQTPSKMNSKWSTPRHIILKLIKATKNLKIRKKETSHFLIWYYGDQRQWHIQNVKRLLIIILSPAKLSSPNAEIKTLPDQQILRGFITSSPALPDMPEIFFSGGNQRILTYN